ncbi:LamG domain-containing protein [Nitrososphaeria virus YSH_1032793]|uniref:LamG domain-containing protein n=1 Tax=Nitrososphaeria virus YSH_1032793 TaxID=3071320 RepID=A0A976UB10_9CAUD|nr:LamG domain-containing protein [Yangshan Harbor Nitrososphaeria virus]UVF62227.1 LamG domain-containing protein [Nitrososphaeria virus YSH_1032793]
MTDYDGQSGFNGNNVTGTKLDTVVVWTGTALPVGVANKVPQYGKFLLLDSLSTPTTATWYIQTSATLSSPNFVVIPLVPEAHFDTDQIKAYYKFNEQSGNIVNVARLIGSTDSLEAEDLTVSGATYSVAGKIGTCLSFDGVNDYAKGQTALNWKFLNDANDWSFSLWFKNSTPEWANDNVILSSCDASATNGIIFDVRDTGDIRCIITKATVGVGGTWNTNFSDSNWKHYIVTYDNTAHELELWCDGVSKGTISTTIPSGNTPDHPIYFMDPVYGGALQGLLDEVIFFKRKITSAEIAVLYGSGSGFAL